MNDGRDAQKGAGDINSRLYDIGPDHRRQPAFEGINQRQQGDDRDGRDFSRAQCNGHYDRNCVNPNALCRRPREQK